MGTVMRSLVACLTAGALMAGAATASAPPVGPLPPGRPLKVAAHLGAAIVISLPKPTVKGRVWRIARAYNGAIVRELAEGETRTTIWVRYRARRIGSTRIVYALTLGEGRHAYAARRVDVTVIP